MKRTLLITISIVVIILTILWCAFFLYVITGMFATSYSEPPEPTIRYGEFPFRITYELNDEIKIYEDVVICEYVGVKSYGTGGKWREWTCKLKSGNERIILLQGEEDGIKFEVAAPIPGLPEYYMGDFRFGQNREDYERVMRNDRYLGYYQWLDDTQTSVSITKEEAWEKYLVKILSVETAPPIENSFGKTGDGLR